MTLDQTLEELRLKQREGFRFEVVCSKTDRTIRIIKTQIRYQDANKLALQLQTRHDLRNPGKSTWVKRLYWARLAVQPIVRTCPVCGARLTGKALLCSVRCRKRASRSRHTSRSETVTEGRAK